MFHKGTKTGGYIVMQVAYSSSFEVNQTSQMLAGFFTGGNGDPQPKKKKLLTFRPRKIPPIDSPIKFLFLPTKGQSPLPTK